MSKAPSRKMVEPFATTVGIIGLVNIAINEIRKLLERRRAFIKNNIVLSDLNETLKFVEKLINKINQVKSDFPETLHNAVEGGFNDLLERVQARIEETKDLLTKDEDNCRCTCFADPIPKAFSCIHRFGRAKNTAGVLADLKEKIKEASEITQRLLIMLNTSLNRHSEGMLTENYRPGTKAPVFPANITFHFNTLDDNGRLAAPEGSLKRKLLSSTTSSYVTAATGSGMMHGALGMAGVGKTTALIGLARDVDITAHFVDGVWYASFGAEASTQDVIHKLGTIMDASGAISSASDVRSQASIDEAASKASVWFRGKTCLFIFDDLWPSLRGSAGGFVVNLKQILQQSPNSRIAVSTRHHDIAVAAGAVVDFGARDPLGKIAISIFKASTVKCLLLRAEKSILGLCAGLPIALALARTCVAKLVSFGDDYEHACDKYANDVREGRKSLVHGLGVGEATLRAGIITSLKYLTSEIEGPDWNDVAACAYSVTELFQSLCIMSNQQIMPLKVLCRMWMVEHETGYKIAELFCSVSLAKMCRHRSECGLQLHDLHLEFSRRTAAEQRLDSTWNARILEGHVARAALPCQEESTNEGTEFSENVVLTFTPRCWWRNDVPNKAYTSRNLARHLLAANLHLELAAIVLNLNWLDVQARDGGILLLKQDFEFLRIALQRLFGQECDSIRAGELVIRAMESSQDDIIDGPRTLSFLLVSLLEEESRKNKLLASLLQKFEAETPKPFLKPTSKLRTALRYAHIAERRIGGEPWGLCASPCGKFIAAGSENDVAILSASSLETLKRLCAHTEKVTCVAFDGTSTKVVSGSFDGRVLVWEWNSCKGPVLELQGHEDIVRAVAVRSDTHRVFSGCEAKTVRIWDIRSGKQIDKLEFNSCVEYLRVCPNRPLLAIGLYPGNLELYDLCLSRTVFKTNTVSSYYRLQPFDFSQDGCHLVHLQKDSSLQLTSTESWTAEGEAFGEMGDNGKLLSVICGADGQQVISGSSNGTIRLYNMADGKCEGASPVMGAPVRELAYLQDRRRIASLSDDGALRIWGSAFAAESVGTTCAHSREVTAVAISSDGKFVASCSLDGTVALWHSGNGRLLWSTEKSTQRSWCVALSPDGRTVVSGSHDGKLTLWNGTTGVLILASVTPHVDGVRCVSYSRDGGQIISGGDYGRIRIWNSSTLEMTGSLPSGHSGGVEFVFDADDHRCIVSRDYSGRTIIRKRDCPTILWTSDQAALKNTISDDEAKSIIMSCADGALRLWPGKFGDIAGALFCKWRSWKIFARVDGEEIVVGAMTSSIYCWAYSKHHSVFVAGLPSGAVAICKLLK